MLMIVLLIIHYHYLQRLITFVVFTYSPNLDLTVNSITVVNFAPLS